MIDYCLHLLQVKQFIFIQLINKQKHFYNQKIKIKKNKINNLNKK